MSRSPAVRRTGSVRVLVDEAHQAAWSIRPDQAARMQPSHPEDSSYARAAALLGRHDFEVVAHAEGALDASALDDVDVVVLPHPADPRYEATTGIGTPMLTAEEITALQGFVERGGGLVVLAENEHDKYANNLNALLAAFGIQIEHAFVQDYEQHHQAPGWVRGQAAGSTRHPLLHAVDELVFYRAGTLAVTSAGAQPVAVTSPTATASGAPLVAAAEHGAGRVAVFADSDLFGDDCLSDFGHAQLWLNTFYWVGRAAFVADTGASPSAVAQDPRWLELRDAVTALRDRQEADATVDLTRHDRGELDALVARVASAVESLAPAFPHEQEYLAAVVDDLRAWSGAGYGKPDFAASLDLFRPDLLRQDGIENLVVFPMYTPNGSLDVRFEALVVRVPWPVWIDELERTSFQNAKFVPVHLVDSTPGYDSECAVLFPETVSVVGPAANHFGGIFCDREAARYQRVVAAAVTSTGLELPPDIEAMLASPHMVQDMFELWDLIHDRAHSHGELPFDPFMIRQRLPFWMYSLEELRCDLTAFAQAGELAQEFPFARYVRYGVLFDRIFRFPITGSRVRNYDGLAGQVLFGYLHKSAVVSWRDNTLHIDWDRLPAAVDALRQEIEELYRDGIDSSRVQYWIAAHDLVRKYVKPNLASQWVPERRELTDESDAKAWVNRVHPDEFPLSMFYRSLQAKLQDAVTAQAAA